MNLKLYFSFIFLWCLSADASGQLITWSADRPLQWSDFRREDTPKHKGKSMDAYVYTLLTDKFDYSTLDSIHVTVTAQCSPHKSWKKHEKLGNYLLQHEQGHFDITELYARKLRKDIQEAERSPKHSKHTREWFSSVYVHTAGKLRQCQRRYDRQTKHSKNREMQRQWNKKIAKELAELKEYAL